MMKKNFLVLFTFCLMLSLTSCKTVTKKDLGMVKEAPNEFLVMSKAPLSIPPEYNARPINEKQMLEEKKQLQNKFQGLSNGEKLFMKNINAEKNNDNIKSELNQEMKALYE